MDDEITKEEIVEQTLPDVIGATLMLTLAMQKLGRTMDEIVEVTNRATVFINEFWAINGYCPVPSDIILGLGLEGEVTVLCPGCGVRMDISDMGWICTLCWLRRPW